MDHARCRGENPELWFPDKRSGRGPRQALEICAVCPVRQPCLDYAMRENIDEGIWGGQTETARRKLRSARARGIA